VPRPLKIDPRIRVSPEDQELLASGWYVDSHGYARRSNPTPPPDKVKLHRLVLERKLGRPLAQGEYSDHINGDRLDNRRENLRPVTLQQNQQNIHGNRRNKAGGLRGVSWHAKAGKWQAVVRHNRKNEYLGLYSNPEEAAAVAAHRRAELGFADSQPTSMELGNGSNAAAAA